MNVESGRNVRWANWIDFGNERRPAKVDFNNTSATATDDDDEDDDNDDDYDYDYETTKTVFSRISVLRINKLSQNILLATVYH